MRRILLLLILASTFALSAIDECKTDVYFGNGILTTQQSAIDNSLLLEKAIKQKFGLPYFNQKIGNVSYVYNETHGFGWDIIESMRQKTGWTAVADFFGDAHGRDLERQIVKYESSLNLRRNILLIAHSQGNLFGYDAYNELLERNNYNNIPSRFEAISVASPMSEDIKDGTPRIDWDNDLVPRIASFGMKMRWMLPNKVRRVEWKFLKGHSKIVARPEPYIYEDNLKLKTYFNWQLSEDGLDENVHAFTFYMGEPLKEGADDNRNYKQGHVYKDIFYKSELIDTQSPKKILTAIKTKLKKLCKNDTGSNNDDTGGGTGAGGSDNNDTGSGDDNTGGGDDNNTSNSDDQNTTDDPTKDPNKVCVSNFFKSGNGEITESLKKGDKDAKLYSDGTKHQVKELQEFLQAFGYDVGSNGADGWFGSDTKDALIAFQDANGLEADGIVGKNTRKVMNNTNCYDKQP